MPDVATRVFIQRLRRGLLVVVLLVGGIFGAMNRGEAYRGARSAIPGAAFGASIICP